MKLYQILLCSILSFVTLTACQSTLSEDSLVGKWKITDFETDAQLSPMLIQSAKQIALTSTYIFNQDGTFEYEDMYSEGGNLGNWSFHEDSKEITLSGGESNPEAKSTLLIKNYSGDEMEWEEDMGGGLGSTISTLQRID